MDIILVLNYIYTPTFNLAIEWRKTALSATHPCTQLAYLMSSKAQLLLRKSKCIAAVKQLYVCIYEHHFDLVQGHHPCSRSSSYRQMKSNVTLFVMTLEALQVTLMAQLNDVFADQIQTCTVRLYCITASHHVTSHLVNNVNDMSTH